MSTQIRSATPQDSPELAQLINAIFDESVTETHIHKMLSGENRITRIAVTEVGKIVGFVDGFQTYATDGTRRDELDLLGVHPAYRRNRIGQNLIRAFVSDSQKDGLIRTLVAVGNTPMHKAMTHTGFTLQPEVCGLFIATDGTPDPDTASTDTYCISVDTLTYRGVWLEGQITPDGIAAAHAIRERDSRDLIGAVISVNDAESRRNVTAANFELAAKFQWWLKSSLVDPAQNSDYPLA